jgi:hypothetical protein
MQPVITESFVCSVLIRFAGCDTLVSELQAYLLLLLLLLLVQTGSGAHPTFYPMRTGGSFSGGEAAGT